MLPACITIEPMKPNPVGEVLDLIHHGWGVNVFSFDNLGKPKYFARVERKINGATIAVSQDSDESYADVCEKLLTTLKKGLS